MIRRNLVTAIRWLHIYLSMFSFTALLFFAITGITLNHPDWIAGGERVEQLDGKLNPEWVAMGSPRVEELSVVEYFRNSHHIQATLTDFVTDDSECAVSFKSPALAADVFIDRSTGDYELTVTKFGLVAVLNDLHKGRDSGKTWAILIDISAVLMVFVSLTGFMMIFFLKKKRMSGLLLTALGALLMLILYYFFV